MRIRSTKPEFWRSERIASVDWEDRLVLKGLESYVDDNGVGKDDLALIVGDLFQRDLVREPSRTLARVSEGISRLNFAGLLWRYTSDGTALLYVSFWESIQRVDKPQAGRFPRPDGTMNYKDSTIREFLAKPREPSRTFAPGTGEQGNRGTGEQTTTTAREAEIPLPSEPPEEVDGVVIDHEPVDAPMLIETTSRKAKRYASNASKTVVRQVLGYDYPHTTVERLAVQVDKLRAENKPDDAIRASIAEWDTRDGAIPEWLPTVYGDLVKAQHATPGNNGRPVHKMRAAANLAAELREAESLNAKELA